MKTFILALSLAAASVGAAQAQSMNKNDSGTTGALGNVNANGIATDPGGVRAQQGRSVNASPGTVGAAPAADTPSQKPATAPNK